MDINPSEITKVIKDQIKNFGKDAEVSEVGQVLSVGDGYFKSLHSSRIAGLQCSENASMRIFWAGITLSCNANNRCR